MKEHEISAIKIVYALIHEGSTKKRLEYCTDKDGRWPRLAPSQELAFRYPAGLPGLESATQ